MMYLTPCVNQDYPDKESVTKAFYSDAIFWCGELQRFTCHSELVKQRGKCWYINLYYNECAMVVRVEV